MSNHFLKNLEKIAEDWSKAEEAYDADCDAWWNSLPQDQQLQAFYSVIKRVIKAELGEHGSYRYIQYDVFGFGPGSYTVGMQCGFMDLHNAIYTPDDIANIKDKK